MSEWIKIPQVGVILNPRQKRTQKMLAQGLSMAQISHITSTSLDVVEDDICTIHAADFMNQKLEGKMNDTKIKRTRWSDDEIAQLIAFRQMGATSKEIAEKLGRTRGTVDIKLHELRKSGALAEPDETEMPERVEQVDEPIVMTEEHTAGVPEAVLNAVEDKITELQQMVRDNTKRAESLLKYNDAFIAIIGVLEAWLKDVQNKSTEK